MGNARRWFVLVTVCVVLPAALLASSARVGTRPAAERAVAERAAEEATDMRLSRLYGVQWGEPSGVVSRRLLGGQLQAGRPLA